MKVIVDIENKTLKMLENNRAIFKGEYSADKLVLLINKTLVNEYPVITGLLSNGRKIGGYTTDSSYGTETIDGVTYTTAEFTLSKENGFPLSAGVTQITIWMYRTKDSVLVSKEAIGNVVFTVVDTTAFNDGDIIISGDVEGTVVNLKVELENLQQVAQINNVAINNLQNNKADKTTLNDYLKRDGSKPMTGDLDMDSYDITNTRLYDKETHNYIALSGLDIGALLFSSKSGALELRSPEMDDLDTSNFLLYPTPENTNHIAGQEYETYEWNLPKESGTLETKENVSDLFAKNLTKENLSEIIKDATQSLSGLMSSQDKRHLDTLVNLLEENNDNVVNTINEILAIFNQYPEGAEILSVLNEKLNKSELLPIIEENAEKTSTLDIGTSATFDATSDEQIPTSKAVSNLMASAGGGSKLYEHNIKVRLGNPAANIAPKDMIFKITTINKEPYDISYILNYLNTWISNCVAFSGSILYFTNGYIKNNNYGSVNLTVYFLCDGNNADDTFGYHMNQSINSGEIFTTTDSNSGAFISNFNDNVIEL